jgi:nucleoside 2-deoxyribosyltransferase
MKIYLAGKMTGLTVHQMRAWREHAKSKLKSAGYIVLDPCDTRIKDILEPSLVVASNMAMIKQADIILMEIAYEGISFGTACELGVCASLNKPVVAFTQLSDDHAQPDFVSHPWICGTIKYTAELLDDAIDAIERAFPILV